MAHPPAWCFPTRLRPIDTTGAGDAFAAAMLDGLMDDSWPPSGESLQSSLREAARVAGGVALLIGAQARLSSESIGVASR